MKTVGQILQTKREEKGLTLEAVESATKIRTKFLKAMEVDDYTRLPSLAYAKGFVKNYAEFLGLSSNDIMAFFRRQTTEIPRSAIVPKGVANPLDEPKFRLTPGRFVTFLITALVAAFVLYFGLQYRNLQAQPTLVVDTPADKTVTSQQRIDVIGKTDPDATVAINGVTVMVRSDGKFFDQIQLEPGVNRVAVVATSRFGKMTTRFIEIGLQQP